MSAVDCSPFVVMQILSTRFILSENDSQFLSRCFAFLAGRRTENSGRSNTAKNLTANYAQAASPRAKNPAFRVGSAEI
jgi:hypothetical protein